MINKAEKVFEKIAAGMEGVGDYLQTLIPLPYISTPKHLRSNNQTSTILLGPAGALGAQSVDDNTSYLGQAVAANALPTAVAGGVAGGAMGHAHSTLADSYYENLIDNKKRALDAIKRKNEYSLAEELSTIDRDRLAPSKFNLTTGILDSMDTAHNHSEPISMSASISRARALLDNDERSKKLVKELEEGIKDLSGKQGKSLKKLSKGALIGLLGGATVGGLAGMARYAYGRGGASLVASKKEHNE